VLESSDLVATVPEVLARRSLQHFRLASCPHPVDLPPIEIHAFWHTKYHQDPANRWLRELIVQQFGESAACSAGV
jgi:DNA-binding transcriptional LysR family regulator